MTNSMNVAVIGLGRLGLPFAAVLAAGGHNVTGVDVDLGVVRAVRDKRVPDHIHEPGLAELLGGGNIAATTDIGAAANAEISVVLVPTPSEGDGAFSLNNILDVCWRLGEALRRYDHRHIVVIASTVSPGSCRGAISEVLERESGRKIGEALGLCYCPDFVALGSVVHDYMYPDFVLVGESDRESGEKVAAMHEQICSAPILFNSLIDAEAAKVALNCYIAMKITFANEWAELCEALPGCNVDEVMGVLEVDSRISPKYLRGATAYGGRCFPRDTMAMIRTMEGGGAASRLVSAVHGANEWQVRRLVYLIRRHWKMQRGRGHNRVGVLGLAFKPGTNATDGSVGMALLEMLYPREDVVAYDPIAVVGRSVRTGQECVDQSGVVVVVTPCTEFKELDFKEGQTVIDCWRILDGKALAEKGVNYVGIGLGLNA